MSTPPMRSYQRARVSGGEMRTQKVGGGVRGRGRALPPAESTPVAQEPLASPPSSPALRKELMTPARQPPRTPMPRGRSGHELDGGEVGTPDASTGTAAAPVPAAPAAAVIFIILLLLGGSYLWGTASYMRGRDAGRREGASDASLAAAELERRRGAPSARAAAQPAAPPPTAPDWEHFAAALRRPDVVAALENRPPQPPTRTPLPLTPGALDVVNDDEAMALAKGEYGPAVLFVEQPTCGPCRAWEPIVAAAAAAAPALRFAKLNYTTCLRTALLLRAERTPWMVGVRPGGESPTWLYMEGARTAAALADLVAAVQAAPPPSQVDVPSDHQ